MAGAGLPCRGPPPTTNVLAMAPGEPVGAAGAAPRPRFRATSRSARRLIVTVPASATRRGSRIEPVATYLTVSVPVICVGWTMQMKVYVPAGRAGTV